MTLQRKSLLLFSLYFLTGKNKTKKQNDDVKNNVHLPQLLRLRSNRLRRLLSHLLKLQLQPQHPSHLITQNHLQKPIIPQPMPIPILFNHLLLHLGLSPRGSIILHPNAVQKVQDLEGVKITRTISINLQKFQLVFLQVIGLGLVGSFFVHLVDFVFEGGSVFSEFAEVIVTDLLLGSHVVDVVVVFGRRLEKFKET